MNKLKLLFLSLTSFVCCVVSAQTYSLRIGESSVLAEFPDNNQLLIYPFNSTAGSTGGIKMYELGTNGSNYVGFRSADLLSNDFMFTLPANYGNTGEVLQSNGSGGLSWAAGSGLFTSGTGLSWSGNTLNSVWSVSGTNIYNNNTGNIGIGTTNFTAKLHVVGTNSNTAGDHHLRLAHNFGWRVDAATGQNMVLEGNNSGTWFPSVTVNRVAGNVGIGTTSPSEMLHVGPGSNRYMLVNSQGVITARFDDNNAVNLFNLENRGMTATGHGVNMNFGLNIGGAAAIPSGQIRIASEDTYAAAANQDSYMMFSTASNANLNEKMRINSDGNVGIATTAPGQKLDVNGKVSIRGGNINTSINGTQLLFGYGGTTSYQHAIKTRHDSGFDNANAIDFYVWDYGTDAAGAEPTKRVMTVDGNGTGMVGIGTSTPAYTLQVGQETATDNINYSASISRHGSLASPGTYTADTPALRVWDVANDGPAAPETRGIVDIAAPRIGDADVNAGNAMLLSITNDNGHAIAVRGNRNVGIGTAVPAARLDIRPLSATASFQFTSSGDNYPRLYMGGTSTTIAFVINRLTPAATMYFGEPADAGGFNFRGTGTSTISSLSGTGTRYVVADASGNLSATTTASGIVGGSGTLNYLAKWTPNGTTLGNSLIFDNGTSVGISSASPGYKLDVNGSFRTAAGANLTIFNDYIYVSPTNNNTLNSAYNTNGIADMWINYRGYNDGFSQYRNLNVGNGQGGNIAWFDGTNKRMSINNAQVANYTLDVNGDARIGATGGVLIASLDANTVNIRPSIANGDIRISDDSGQIPRAITIANGGALGVGTDAPAGRFDVYGDIYGVNEYSFPASEEAINAWDYGGLDVNPTVNDYPTGSWYIQRNSAGWAGGTLSKRRFRRTPGLTLEYEAYLSDAVSGGSAVHFMVGFVAGASTDYSYNQTPSNLLYHNYTNLYHYDNGASGSTLSFDTRNAWWKFRVVLTGQGAEYYVYNNGWQLIGSSTSNSDKYVRVLIAAYYQRFVVRNMKVYQSNFDNATNGQPGSSSVNSNTIFTHWGRPDCPSTSSLVYTGIAAGGHYQHASGGNTLCLTSSPDWTGASVSDLNQNGGLVYGLEFETNGHGVNFTNFTGAQMQNYDARCAVCNVPGATVTLMIPGATVCPANQGWTRQYWGYLMSSRHEDMARSEFVCVANNPTQNGSNANSDGNLWYPVETELGSLTSPYVQNRELTCVVCTK